MTTFKPRRFRRASKRTAKRYSSDLSQQEWQVIQPLLPPPSGGRGRKREVNEREILNAIFYQIHFGLYLEWLAQRSTRMADRIQILPTLAAKRYHRSKSMTNCDGRCVSRWESDVATKNVGTFISGLGLCNEVVELSWRFPHFYVVYSWENNRTPALEVSIVKPSRRRKKGGDIRLRRGQTDQRTQAVYSSRYVGIADIGSRD